MHTEPRVLKLVLLLTAAAVAMPAAAQEEEEQTSRSTPESAAAAPRRLDAGVDIGGGYNDNVYATRNKELDDFYLLARPFVRADLGSGDNRLSIRGEGEIGRYAELTSEDYEDWTVATDGRARLSNALALVGGAEWRWEHENRSSPEAVSGLEPTQYQRGFGYLGLIGSSNDFNARLAGTLARYDFDDVPTLSGVIDNDDRDRLMGEIGARAGIELESGPEVFVQGAYDFREYDEAIDNWGYRRESDGFSIAAGVRGKLGGGFTGEVFAGWLQQNYDDARLPDVDTFDVGAAIDWTGDGGLGGTLRIDRSVEETTLPGASGYVVTSGRISLRTSVHPRLTAGVGLGGYHYDYVGHPRTEFVAAGDIWARYWLNRHLYLDAEYRHAERSSNAAGFDYDQNRFLLTLGARVRPGYAADAMPITLGGAAPAGAYVGLLASHGTLIAGLDGPRGRGGNTADFGDHGAAAVVVAGYGTLVNSLYLGLEAEGSLGGPDWIHTADRVFSMDKENALGIAARLGWATPRGALFYSRFGVSSAVIQHDYTHRSHVYSEDERRTGLGGGLGIEAPAGRKGFVRAEYVVTSYDDIDVPAGGGGSVDNFSATESQFRIGGGFRFGTPAATDPELAPIDFSGPYVGLQIGHGSLVTSNQGTRSGGTLLDVTRASHGGLLGLFAGYGAVFDRAYLGLEAEADTTAVNWNIEREPTGRIYSAEHDYSYGASARAGVLLGAAALAYGRVGVVRTRFDVPFATTGTAVREKDTRTGLRFGGGMELGLGRGARLRADYSLTRYDRYDIEYGRNSDRFDHAEALFRMGLAWRL